MHLVHDLAHYSYSAEEIRSCVRTADFWTFGPDPARIVEITEQISESFYANRYAIDKILCRTLRGRSLFPVGSFSDALCLRRTDKILRRALSTVIVHRNYEIQHLLTTLRGEHPCKILRTDIKSFFESVDFCALIAKLQKDGFRNTAALGHLYELNKYLVRQYKFNGLPRGIGVSSTLADYIMQNMDQRLQTTEGVCYYARYVDDICIVHNLEDTEIYSLVLGLLPDGLKLNEQKTHNLSSSKPGWLEFLGYSINVVEPSKVSIAKDKIGKIKKRIALTINAYLRNRDFLLLRDRLRFLTCTVAMDMSGRESRVHTGFRHTYRFCSEPEILNQLQELDGFYFSFIKSKRYYLAKMLRASVSRGEWTELLNYSFRKAYVKKYIRSFDQIRIAAIKEAWAYA